jgi:hypothetical protein
MKEGNMQKHIDLIGIFWIALGSLTFFGGFVAFWVLFGVSFIPDMGPEAPVILRAVGIGVGIFLFILSIPKIIAGVGLLKKQEWARILTLILSFLSLINIPLGTALAIYSFVILTKEESIQLFRSQTKSG